MPETSGVSRDEQREATRTALLTAAAHQFAAHGFTATNLSDIAQSVGVTRGLLHFYFRTKPELAREVIRSFHATWPAFVAAARQREGSRLDAMKWLTHAAAEQYRTDPFVRATVRLTRERDLIGIDTPAPFVAWIEFATLLIEAGKQTGEFRADIDAHETATFLISAYYGIQFTSGDLTGWDDIHERLSDMWDVVTPYFF